MQFRLAFLSSIFNIYTYLIYKSLCQFKNVLDKREHKNVSSKYSESNFEKISQVSIILFFAEPLRLPEDYPASDQRRRPRRNADDRDGLALSREIFRNITKQLRENIKREGATDKADHLLQSL